MHRNWSVSIWSVGPGEIEILSYCDVTHIFVILQAQESAGIFVEDSHLFEGALSNGGRRLQQTAAVDTVSLLTSAKSHKEFAIHPVSKGKAVQLQVVR